MPALLEKLTARLALLHAGRVYAGFTRSLERFPATQQQTWNSVRALLAGSAYARALSLDRAETVEDLRRAAPLSTYEDVRPWIDRTAEGDLTAMFRPGVRLLMFATSSGTTSAPKRIPVTPEFAASYRRTWNTFGLKMLRDHPEAILRDILQSSGRMDESRAPSGIPCGAITGLLARNQKRIVRRFYVGAPCIAELPDARDRYYTLMRLGLARDVAFGVTANPATFIRMAQIADESSETLIRDVRDGTLTLDPPAPTGLLDPVLQRLRPNPARAAELEAARDGADGVLRPRDCWNLAFLACWTGGSMGHYLSRVAEWYGDIPVRDVGLLASEGRVTIPLDDGTPAGPLDPASGVFEFIPAEQDEAARPDVLLPHEVEVGRQYIVLLTNHSGLVRYRLDDVVRVTGRLGATPVVEFLHRAGGVSSVAGEKLTEHQVVTAFQATCAQLNTPEFDFALGPEWGDPPVYRLWVTRSVPGTFAARFDEALAAANEEYASRRKSQRLNALVLSEVDPQRLAALHQAILERRGSTPEQYKRPCLFAKPDELAARLDNPHSAP